MAKLLSVSNVAPKILHAVLEFRNIQWLKNAHKHHLLTQRGIISINRTNIIPSKLLDGVTAYCILLVDRVSISMPNDLL